MENSHTLVVHWSQDVNDTISIQSKYKRLRLKEPSGDFGTPMEKTFTFHNSFI